jgi:hypothetical protein
MACILADYGPLEDVTINIEHTLLEAYCMENYIKVIKVSNVCCILLRMINFEILLASLFTSLFLFNTEHVFRSMFHIFLKVNVIYI